MARYQLAQLNIAVAQAPLDSPVMAEFVANIDRIDALAERSPGFIWRATTEAGDATALRPLGDNMIINMSVWTDAEALKQYVYHSAHVEFMRRRREWFERMAEAHMVLWWVPEGHQPSLAEALERLELLRQHGPTPAAFTFRQLYPAPESAQASAPLTPGSAIPAS